jgi:hypothetical protein
LVRSAQNKVLVEHNPAGLRFSCSAEVSPGYMTILTASLNQVAAESAIAPQNGARESHPG